MKNAIRVVGNSRNACRQRLPVGSVGCWVILLLLLGALQARAGCPRVVSSQDGTPISYEVYGAGEPTLVFVHGWSCDARYWREQVPYFSRKQRVVTLDLAGHGHSGFGRPRYDMKAFGEDVRAVTEATGSHQVILIGHSMGGPVIAEAARLMPSRVIGLIGIDTFDNIEYPMTRKQVDELVAPLKRNFRKGSRQFAREMIASRTDPGLREWILADMSAAAPWAAISAMEEMMAQHISGEAARIFEDIRIPVVCVNGGLWPLDYAANRRHMFSFDAIVLKEADHFLMLDYHEEFNGALEKAIEIVIGKAGRGSIREGG